jgi:hypothetical protein
VDFQNTRQCEQSRRLAQWWQQQQLQTLGELFCRRSFLFSQLVGRAMSLSLSLSAPVSISMLAFCSRAGGKKGP